MKRYVAIHYIPLNGRMYTPGEIISEKMTGEQAKRLLRNGAMRAMADSSHGPAVETKGDPPAASQKHDVHDGARGDESPDDDGDEADGDPPVIDVTEGIVTPAEGQQEAPPQAGKPVKPRGGRT